MKILCMGDSLTYGYGVRRNKVWTSILAEEMPGMDFVNRGVSGNTTAEIKKRLMEAVLVEVPDLIILMAGSNDIFMGEGIEAAKKNLVDMITECKKNDVDIIVMTPFPINDETMIQNWKKAGVGGKSQEALLNLRFWIKEFCDSKKILCIDTWRCFSEGGEECRCYYQDGIHLSEYGHKKFSDYILNKIEHIY